MFKTVKIEHGSGGWGGPLVVRGDEKKNKILCVTGGGGIHPVAAKLAEMTGCTAVDGFKNRVPDDEILVAVVDCGGTARCGVYPKKGIATCNLLGGGPSGPLAAFIKETNYASAVTEKSFSFADAATEEALAADMAQKAVADTAAAAAEEEIAAEGRAMAGEAPAEEPKKQANIVTRIGVGVGHVVNKFFAAGRESIEMVIRNILPFMAFTSTILGIISASGLGNVIANTIAPFCSTLPGMLIISVVCAIPFLSPVLGPGAVIAQIVGTLLGSQFAAGTIPPQFALPALFAIDAQVGADFVPVGLSLGEAESSTIELGVPAVLYSRLITGPLAVLIAYAFSIGLYA